MDTALRRPLPLLLALAAAALVGGCRGPAAETRPDLAHLRGPVVRYDASRLGKDRAEACARAAAARAPADRREALAGEAGMLPDDLEAIRLAAREQRATVTFRDSNTACAPHLRAGMESKGHEVMTKTFTAESLPPGFEYLAGTVSTLEAKPHHGEHLKDPLAVRYLTKDGQPLTCDYDLMDVLDDGGARITGETPRDLALRAALNAVLPLRGAPAHHVDRIKHGAQAEYPAYLRARAARGEEEPVHLELLRLETPLTVADKDGELWRLEAIEDALNFYRCAGAGTPPEWVLEAEGR